jgi:hypothetical protein
LQFCNFAILHNRKIGKKFKYLGEVRLG